MIDPSKYSEKIQKYLDNELSSSELSEFEEIIKIHPELQDEIRLYRKVTHTINDPALENFKIELDTIHEENFSSKIRMNKNNFKQWYLVAASVLVLITVGTLLIFQSDKAKPQDVFEKYYKTYEPIVTRSVISETDFFNQGIEAYISKRYDLAFAKFDQLAQIDDNNYAAKLLMGVCSIEMGDFSIAEKQFSAIIESKDPFYVQDAEWYLALMFLNTNNTEKAIAVLNTIVNNRGMYTEKASLILDEL